MNILRLSAATLALILAVSFRSASAAPADGLANVKTQADLDGVIASTTDATLKQALHDNAAAIVAAAELRPHVEAVVATVATGMGKVEKINTTPEGLKKAAGGDVPLFNSLKMVDLSVVGMGPHDHRKVDPYTAAFFEHLSHIKSLESLNVISTQANDEWIAPLGKLTNLKKLSFVNNGKLTDVGLEELAGLSELETFSYVGTAMKGHAFAKFDGWAHLTHCSFRGSSIDDEGLQQLCDHFPNLESISLAHAKFTDAGAINLAKLTKLKGLELGTHTATAQTLVNVQKLPLDYLQLGEGFDGPEAIALIKDMKTLHRLTLTDCKKLTDAEVKTVAGMTQLQSLEFGNFELTDARVAELQAFAFLKAFRLVHRPPYSPEIQSKIKAELPKVALKFE